MRFNLGVALPGVGEVVVGEGRHGFRGFVGLGNPGFGYPGYGYGGYGFDGGALERGLANGNHGDAYTIAQTERNYERAHMGMSRGEYTAYRNGGYAPVPFVPGYNTGVPFATAPGTGYVPNGGIASPDAAAAQVAREQQQLAASRQTQNQSMAGGTPAPSADPALRTAPPAAAGTANVAAGTGATHEGAAAGAGETAPTGGHHHHTHHHGAGQVHEAAPDAAQKKLNQEAQMYLERMGFNTGGKNSHAFSKDAGDDVAEKLDGVIGAKTTAALKHFNIDLSKPITQADVDTLKAEVGHTTHVEHGAAPTAPITRHETPGHGQPDTLQAPEKVVNLNLATGPEIKEMGNQVPNHVLNHGEGAALQREFKQGSTAQHPDLTTMTSIMDTKTAAPAGAAPQAIPVYKNVHVATDATPPAAGQHGMTAPQIGNEVGEIAGPGMGQLVGRALAFRHSQSAVSAPQDPALSRVVADSPERHNYLHALAVNNGEPNAPDSEVIKHLEASLATVGTVGKSSGVIADGKLEVSELVKADALGIAMGTTDPTVVAARSALLAKEGITHAGKPGDYIVRVGTVMEQGTSQLGFGGSERPAPATNAPAASPSQQAAAGLLSGGGVTGGTPVAETSAPIVGGVKQVLQSGIGGH